MLFIIKQSQKPKTTQPEKRDVIHTMFGPSQFKLSSEKYDCYQVWI